ncbi:DUF6454 family protein [Rubrobacter calidifluminis]|uniref:DUF6454 family protein n=1 Tax=Rubrobacter calidifluminis TaxID=1392640 RepID=UPI002361A150|nr:DUF6454 family protein [Rubrobacter calidifluminis]
MKGTIFSGRVAATVAATLLAILTLVGTVVLARTPNHGEGARGGTIARDFRAVDRDTVWRLTGELPLRFQTYHTEGLAITPHRIFLSAVQVIVPPRKYSGPGHRYDRTPGKGVGHVFVLDREGHLQRDIILGEGHVYHPGGMDFDGENVWVPVAQYRPDSSAIIYRIDARTLAVHRQFEVNDHIGGIVRDPRTGHLIGNDWGSRRFYEWTTRGRRISSWENPDYFIDYQDCQHLPGHEMICGGIADLPQSPSASRSGTYELGGIALIDLRDHAAQHEVPFQYWSPAGHVATRNPFKIAATGDRLTVWVAPDNGDEDGGTKLLTYQTTVAPGGDVPHKPQENLLRR